MFVKNKNKTIGIGEGCSKKGRAGCSISILLNLGVIKDDDYSSSGEEVELSDEDFDD